MNKNLPFNNQVWGALKQIPRGRITTYKILARAINKPRAVRAVGNAVGLNPAAPIVPCHRVIRSDGRIGGYSGRGGIAAKIRLLKAEGIIIKRGRIENYRKLLYTFKV